MAAERGEYRPIPRVLLHGPDFQTLSERARSAFVFLKINLGPAGIEIHYPKALHIELADMTGMPIDALRGSLDELEAAGWIARELNVIWVVDQLRYDPHMDAKNANHRTGIQRHIQGLPRLAIVRRFIQHYPEFFEGIDDPAKGYPMAMRGHGNATAITENREPNTEDRKDSVSNETGASAIVENFATGTDGMPATALQQVMGSLRKHGFNCDSHDGSIAKLLLRKRLPPETIGNMAEGLALMRDKGALRDGYHIDPGGKLSMKLVYAKQKGTQMPLWRVAEVEFEQQRKNFTPRFNNLGITVTR